LFFPDGSDLLLPAPGAGSGEILAEPENGLRTNSPRRNTVSIRIFATRREGEIRGASLRAQPVREIERMAGLTFPAEKGHAVCLPSREEALADLAAHIRQ
jgi:hypothetical protein